MNATKFVSKTGESVWTNGNVVSMGVDTSSISLDNATGFVNEERNIFFIKGNSEEVVAKQQEQVINLINKGQLAVARVFSKTPFYTKADGKPQDPDMNPSTGEVLGRYSQTRLCSPQEYLTLNRSFVVNEVAVAPAGEIEASA